MGIKSNFSLRINLVPLKLAIAKAQEKALLEGLQEVVADAKKGSPKLTGHNADTITQKVTPGGRKAAVFTESGYGGYLEVGTRRMAARPYIRPAFEKHKGKILAALRNSI